MKCPHCNFTGTPVLETRGDYRRRRCGKCDKDFITLEVAQPPGTRLARRDRRVGKHIGKAK